MLGGLSPLGRGEFFVPSRNGIRAVAIAVAALPRFGYHAQTYARGSRFMRKAVAALLLIAACFAPGMVKADGDAAHHRHRRVAAPVCSFENRLYGEGQFCTIGCVRGVCSTQTCHDGHWIIAPARCAASFGCPRFC